jgi:protein TonB
MTYASANRRPNPAALVGALGIPGAFGALLVVGLAVTVVTVPKTPNPRATPIADMPLPPPPPTPDKPQPDAKTPANPATPTTVPLPIPLPPIGPLPVDLGRGDPLTLPGAGDLGGLGGGGIVQYPQPSPSASPFDPVGARPKGNASRWVTNDDYRSRWIMEGMAGRAGFTLSIDAGGKVTGCTITRSTGHAPLDAATCQLVTKRARFESARDGNGKPVAGSYSGVVTWQIPE